MLWLIILGIIAYAAGDGYIELFNIACGAGLIWAVIRKIAERAPARKERREERKRIREIEAAQKEICRISDDIKSLSVIISGLFHDSKPVEAIESCDEETEVVNIEPKPAEQKSVINNDDDPFDINIKELTIAQLQKRLNVLYSRMDKLKYQHGYSPEAWEKYMMTATYRGLEWDIADTEQRIARAIETEKRKWAKI